MWDQGGLDKVGTQLPSDMNLALVQSYQGGLDKVVTQLPSDMNLALVQS